MIMTTPITAVKTPMTMLHVARLLMSPVIVVVVMSASLLDRGVRQIANRPAGGAGPLLQDLRLLVLLLLESLALFFGVLCAQLDSCVQLIDLRLQLRFAVGPRLRVLGLELRQIRLHCRDIFAVDGVGDVRQRTTDRRSSD